MRIMMWVAIVVAALLFAGCGVEKELPSADPAEEEIPMGDAGRKMYFQKRCDAGHGGMCGELALMWREGWGGQKDEEKAKQVYRSSCDQGVPTSCDAIGEKLEPKRQAEILEANCAKGVAFACNNLGHLLWMGEGIEKNPVEAREKLTVACDEGFSASCKALTKMWGLGKGGAKDTEKAKEYRKKAEAAKKAETAMELKYLHSKPMSQRPVGKARPSQIEARKKQSLETDAMNRNIIKDAFQKKAPAPK